MKLRISYSQIDEFQRCSRRWFLKYRANLGVVGETARPLDFGTAFHAGQEAWWTGEGSVQDRLQNAHMMFAANADNLSFEDKVLGPALLTGYAVKYLGEELRFHSLPVAERMLVVPVLDPDGNVDPDLELVAKMDVVGYDQDGNTVLVEHKTTSSNMSTPSFWSRFDRSMQLPIYAIAATDLGRRPTKLILDAVRAPQMHRMRATPIEKREFYKRATGDARVGDPRPGTRLRDETREEFEVRCVDGILEDPNEYFARKEYFFDDHTLNMARIDVWSVGRDMLEVIRREGATGRNSGGCEKFNSLCGYAPACWGGAELTDTTLFQVRSRR